jgi:hypothetical protein
MMAEKVLAPVIPAVSQRKRIPRWTKVDFWLDLALFAAFAVDYAFRFTGLAIHEWLGLGFGITLLVHVLLHWDWVVKTTSRILGRLVGRERVRWIVDFALLGAMTLCVASGVLVSRSALRFIGLTMSRDSFWTGLHTTSADICLFLVAVHVALSWRWLLSVSKRLLGRRRLTSRASS